MQSARARLIEQEKRSKNTAVRHAGELPSQVHPTCRSCRTPKCSCSRSSPLPRTVDRKFMIDRQLSDAAMMDPVIITPSLGQLPAAELSPAQAAGRREGKPGRGRKPLTPAHPTCQTASQIAQLEAKAEKEALERPLAGSGAGAAGRTGGSGRLSRIRDISSRARTSSGRSPRSWYRKRLAATIEPCTSRQLAAVPTRASGADRADTRSRNPAHSLHEPAGEERERHMAMNMERRQIGEPFRLWIRLALPSVRSARNRPSCTSWALLQGLRSAWRCWWCSSTATRP